MARLSPRSIAATADFHGRRRVRPCSSSVTCWGADDAQSILAALLVGMIFGAGLALSDMVNPARVQAFLDVAGRWDPTLLYVMGSALIPSALAYLSGAG